MSTQSLHQTHPDKDTGVQEFDEQVVLHVQPQILGDVVLGDESSVGPCSHMGGGGGTRSAGITLPHDREGMGMGCVDESWVEAGHVEQGSTLDRWTG